MKIQVQPSQALDVAMGMINAGRGMTSSIEVIDELLVHAPEDTVFEREGLEALSMQQMRRLRDQGFDPR